MITFVTKYPPTTAPSEITEQMYVAVGPRQLAKNAFSRDFLTSRAVALVDLFVADFTKVPAELKMAYLGAFELELAK